MTTAPAGSEPGGFELGPELLLLLLGVIATLIVLGVALWLVRQMHLEDRAQRALESNDVDRHPKGGSDGHG